MSIFQKTVPSVKISKKIDNLQSQLQAIEEQAASKNTQIEKAISEGEVSDKSFAELANIKVKGDAVRGVLAKMQSEYNAAQAREARDAKAAELDRFEEFLEKNIASLGSNLAGFGTAAKGLLEKKEALDDEYRRLFAIAAPAGINFSMFPRFDTGFITVALTYQLPMNTPRRALATAEAEATSNLTTIRNGMLGGVAQARGALDVEVAPPVAEPIVAAAPKRKVDGGLELYHRDRKAGIERLKASRDVEESSRDAEVRDEVAERDAEDDAGIADRYTPMSHFTK